MGVASDAAGSVYAAGYYRDAPTLAGFGALPAASGRDSVVFKRAASGTIAWVRALGGTGDDGFDAVAVGPGVVAASGTFGQTGATDAMVVVLDAGTGATRWTKTFGGTGTSADDALAVAFDSAGNLFVTGYIAGTADLGTGPITTTNGALNVFLAKFDPSGTALWAKTFSNNGSQRGYGIATDTGGDVFIVGNFLNSIDFSGRPMVGADPASGPPTMSTQNTIALKADAFIASFTSTGTYRWSRQVGSATENEQASAVAVDGTGAVLVIGLVPNVAIDAGTGALSPAATSGDQMDVWLAKYANAGAPVWARRFGGPGATYGYGVSIGAGDRVRIAGGFNGTPGFGGITLASMGGSNDAFVAGFTSTGAPEFAERFGGTGTETARAVTSPVGSPPVIGGYFMGSGVFAGVTLTSVGSFSDGFVVQASP